MKNIILTAFAATLLLANPTENPQEEVKTVIEKAEVKVAETKAEVQKVVKKNIINATITTPASQTEAKIRANGVKRISKLEAILAKREEQRNEKAALREAKIKQLHDALDEKAKVRASVSIEESK